MQDFLRLLDEYFDQVAAVAAAELDERQRLLRESLRGAIAGDWAPFEGHLRTQGALQARLGVRLSGIFELVRRCERALVALLVQRHGSAPDRLSAALDAMHCLSVHAMAVVADEYLAVRERGALSELELLNRQLATQNEELIRAGRGKSDFLAMMSHELRTPLNSIIGFSEVLVDQKFGPLNERQSRYLRNVNDSGRHLLSLINDLLDLSKIEAGRFEVMLRPCALRPIASDAVATLLPLAASHRITVDIEHHGGPFVVMADGARLKQVLYNLLSNAIKFTPTGGHVTLAFGRAPENGRVRASVTDSGPGIAPEDQGRLFTSFTRLSNAEGREGTGLGLALTKQLVELMGGTIGIQSAVGSGSTFFVDLPEHDAPDRAAPQPTTDAEAAPLALVVDDDSLAQELLVLSLQESGFRTLVAATGEEALAAARRHRPDVITLDVFLPTIDGWDVLRLLKTDGETADIPVVMVSISSDRGKAFSLGALEHLIKPVARETLLAALSRHSFTTKVRAAPVHVLAIDDDVNQLDLFRAALEPRGFVVRTATTARAGLEAARADPVDLILLDLVMPDLSGVEVVGRLRADVRTSAIPILLITAHELTAEQRTRLNGDVHAIISKGTASVDNLADEIARVLRPSRA
jgi:signal transduction histidine kinase/CheY-like chemotaxis protein